MRRSGVRLPSAPPVYAYFLYSKPLINRQWLREKSGDKNGLQPEPLHFYPPIGGFFINAGKADNIGFQFFGGVFVKSNGGVAGFGVLGNDSDLGGIDNEARFRF